MYFITHKLKWQSYGKNFSIKKTLDTYRFVNNNQKLK